MNYNLVYGGNLGKLNDKLKCLKLMLYVCIEKFFIQYIIRHVCIVCFDFFLSHHICASSHDEVLSYTEAEMDYSMKLSFDILLVYTILILEPDHNNIYHASMCFSCKTSSKKASIDRQGVHLFFHRTQLQLPPPGFKCMISHFACLSSCSDIMSSSGFMKWLGKDFIYSMLPACLKKFAHHARSKPSLRAIVVRGQTVHSANFSSYLIR